MTATAAEVEVGRRLPFGVGVGAGFPPSATGQFYFDPTNALSAHVGPTMTTSGLHLRVQFEQEAAEIRAWDQARLALTWHAGLEANFIFGQASSVRPGIFAGAGAVVQIVPAPVAFFAEVAPVVYPVDLATQTQFLPLGIHVAGGVRFYLGRRRIKTVEPGETAPILLPTAPQL